MIRLKRCGMNRLQSFFLGPVRFILILGGCVRTLRCYWASEKGGRDLRDYLQAAGMAVLVMLLLWLCLF